MCVKRCSRCKEEKDISQFSWKNKKRNLHSSECKPCHRSLRKIYYENNKKQECERSNDRKKRIQNWYKKYKENLKCIQCGENHISVIDFHHKIPTEKNFNISEAVHRGIGIARLIEEINKCDVLCANCHRKLHWNETK